MNLCLGTVQFGLDYGIQGGRKPTVPEAVEIMGMAVDGGVDAIDTAAAYGDAEMVVGRFLAMRPGVRDGMFLVSKFGTDVFEGAQRGEYAARLGAAMRQSLERLGTDRLDAYICHVATAVRDDAVLEAMAAVRSEGLARKVGFSVYETDEALAAIDSGAVDFLQVPYSVLDQRMALAGVFEKAEARGVEVHARSAFVQGLALMDAERVPEWLAAARPLLHRLEGLCVDAETTRRRLALAFVRRRGGISHLVFGVDDARQLREILADFSAPVADGVLDAAEQMFADVDPRLVMPNKWRKL